MKHEQAVFSTFYLGPVSYYACLLKYENIWTEVKEHFIKQSYRNRCSIYGANGKLDLIIPLSGRKNDTKTEDIHISYSEDWQKQHWKSFEAAYRTSPYFEFYEQDLLPFYRGKKFKNLIDFNTALEEVVLELLEIQINRQYTSKYIHEYGKEVHDFREAFHPKEKRRKLIQALPEVKQPRYGQVFESRLGFIKDLSIVDLLFNLGPEAGSYIRELVN